MTIARLSADHSLVLIIDMQTSLMPAICEAAAQVSAVERLAKGAKALSVPVHATEHMAEKLGATIEPLRSLLSTTPNAVLPKRQFDGCRERSSGALFPTQRKQVLVAGAEAHVCVMQTALSMMARGLEVWMVVDACGSRHDLDKQLAMQRLQAAGAHLITSETVLFEWLEGADHPQFKAVLEVIKSRDT